MRAAGVAAVELLLPAGRDRHPAQAAGAERGALAGHRQLRARHRLAAAHGRAGQHRRRAVLGGYCSSSGGCSSAVESWIVIPVVVGSNPIGRPTTPKAPQCGAFAFVDFQHQYLCMKIRIRMRHRLRKCKKSSFGENALGALIRWAFLTKDAGGSNLGCCRSNDGWRLSPIRPTLLHVCPHKPQRLADGSASVS